MKRSPLSRYTPIKKSRSKPRAGRVKGKDMATLRSECFDRDMYQCQECFASVDWYTGHLAHIKAKRRNGDSLDNVRTLCPDCHIKEHAYGPTGEKPCPSKRLDMYREGGGRTAMTAKAGMSAEGMVKRIAEKWFPKQKFGLGDVVRERVESAIREALLECAERIEAKCGIEFGDGEMAVRMLYEEAER